MKTTIATALAAALLVATPAALLPQPAQAQEAVADGVVHIVESFARGTAPHRVAGPEPAAELPIEDAANQLVRAS